MPIRAIGNARDDEERDLLIRNWKDMILYQLSNVELIVCLPLLLITLQPNDTQGAIFLAVIEGFTPIWAKPPNGPLVGLMPVACLEGALELIA